MDEDWTEDGKLIADVTRAVRLADMDLQDSGGSSRHWVYECLLPRMKQCGLRVVRAGDGGEEQGT